MSFPFTPAIKTFTFDGLIKYFRSTIKNFPDIRKGAKQTKYSIKDAVLGAFSVFFTQSPSFLSHQRTMQDNKGLSNAQTLFSLKIIPTPNWIRKLLDPVAPEQIFPVFSYVFDGLKEMGYLEQFKFFNSNLLIALDGVQYHSSQTIHCDCCSTKYHKNGRTTYSHSAITPVIVNPDSHTVISLEPEFITPQDGHNKQDCENAAAKRWLLAYAKRYKDIGATILGDDLYSCQPLCQQILDEELNFILVCKPDSHKILYEWVDSLQITGHLNTVKTKHHKGKKTSTYTYRFTNNVPLRGGNDALEVNWCELIMTDKFGQVIYHNSFVTNHTITESNVIDIVEAGRTRWKIENENNNILKTKGYNFEHNFGHGNQYLSSLLMTFNILAFLFHTLLELMDSKYQLIRSKLPTRKTFFDDIRALTRYLCFDNWESLLNFMIRGLELNLDGEQVQLDTS